LVPGLAVRVYAGLLGSRFSGRSRCRVAAFGLSRLHESDFLFITVSHCAWRHVISLSKATKKRSKENAFNHATLSVHSVQFLFIGAPKARCSPERRMCEPLLLANPDTNTLRPVRSRASTLAKEPPRPHASFRFRFLVRWLRGLNSCFRRQRHLAYWYFRIGTSFLGGLTAWTTRLFSPTTGSRIFAVLFPEELARWFEARAHLVVGRPRIARGAPWAGSITGGEACGYPCSEKEGLTHPPLWRAPCFWGTYE